MATTNLADVADQIQKYWSPIFTKQLRENLLLGSFVDKTYDGQITAQGDTVYVSQVNAPTGQLLTVGTDADTFESEAVSTTRVAIQANKRAVASYEFQDLVSLQSQISQSNPAVMDSLNYAMNKKINDYLYSLVSPSTSSPDHSISGVTDFNASQLAACRLLAAQAKWPEDDKWVAFLDPQYYSDLMNASTMTSADYVGADLPVVGGKIRQKRFGFAIVEDNSRSADYGLLAHPSFMHMVMQTSASVKISDLHSNKRFGLVMSVDIVFGAALGINSGSKHIKVYNS